MGYECRLKVLADVYNAIITPRLLTAPSLFFESVASPIDLEMKDAANKVQLLLGYSWDCSLTSSNRSMSILQRQIWE